MPSQALSSGGILILTAGLLLAIQSGRAQAFAPPVQAFNLPAQHFRMGEQEDDSSSPPSPAAPAGASQEDGARAKVLARFR